MNKGIQSNGSPDLEQGTQALFMMDSMDNYLEHIPRKAFNSMILVSMQDHPNNVERFLNENNIQKDQIKIVPVSGSTLKYTGELDVTKRTGPNDLTGIGIRITEYLQHEEPIKYIVFDNINILLMYADDTRVYRFLDTVIGKTRSTNATGIYFTVRDALKDDTYNKIKQLYDKQIDLRDN